MNKPIDNLLFAMRNASVQDAQASAQLPNLVKSREAVLGLTYQPGEKVTDEHTGATYTIVSGTRVTLKV